MHTISEPYPLTIDRTRTLEQMIQAGRYDRVNDVITQEHFPISGCGTNEHEAFLVHFDFTMSTGAVLAELDRLNLRPGDITELLAFGARYPEVQRLFPIIELASVWEDGDGYHLVAFLYEFLSERHLGVGWFARDRFQRRFLAFRKS